MSCKILSHGGPSPRSAVGGSGGGVDDHWGGDLDVGPVRGVDERGVLPLLRLGQVPGSAPVGLLVGSGQLLVQFPLTVATDPSSQA